jgi:hypothetical protein
MLNLSIGFTKYTKTIIEHQVSFFSFLPKRYKTEVKPLCVHWVYAIFAPTKGCNKVAKLSNRFLNLERIKQFIIVFQRGWTLNREEEE